MTQKVFIPASNNWFWVWRGDEEGFHIEAHRIAVWEQTDRGLIGYFQWSEVHGVGLLPPTTMGRYTHFDDMTDVEKAAIAETRERYRFRAKPDPDTIPVEESVTVTVPQSMLDQVERYRSSRNEYLEAVEGNKSFSKVNELAKWFHEEADDLARWLATQVPGNNALPPTEFDQFPDDTTT
jgi:hypothetical protein